MSVVSRDERAASAPSDGEHERLGRPAREIERERPEHVGGGRDARRQRERPAIHRDRVLEVALGLLAAREPGDGVRLQVGSIEPLGQLHRLGRPAFNRPQIEQQEQRPCQRQHQLASSLALIGIEVTKRGIELTHLHRPFAQRVERTGAARVQLDAQPIGLGSRWLEVERLQAPCRTTGWPPRARARVRPARRRASRTPRPCRCSRQTLTG